MRSLFFRSPSKPKLTGLGWTVILIALASGAAAINTGNNLLYLCWGFILSAVVISGFLSEFNLMNLSLGRQNTPQARVRETCWFPLVMNNRSRFFPAFGVCAELTLELMGKKITAWGEPILSLPAQHQRNAGGVFADPSVKPPCQSHCGRSILLVSLRKAVQKP